VSGGDGAGPRAVLVVGNEKGGSGKTTMAVHLIVALLREGARVASIDLDGRQATLTRHLDNRRVYAQAAGVALPRPEHRVLAGSGEPEADAARLERLVGDLGANADYLVVDTPAGELPLGRHAHGFADILVTPLNDSFLDFDVLANVAPDSGGMPRIGSYAAMVWEQRKRRAARDGGSIDWVVVRNRLSSLDAHNKRAMAEALQRLSKRIGFRLAPGFGERVIFRELFPVGLTLLDLRESRGKLSMSQVAARQELRALLEAVLPDRPAGGLAPGVDPPEEGARDENDIGDEDRSLDG
jgi:chromosome partitioning protein